MQLTKLNEQKLITGIKWKQQRKLTELEAI